MLLDDCVSTILSNTLPLDACRSLSVSSSFRSAANSSIVWERLLPSDYEDIVSRSITPLKFSSKKKIFVCLCDPILTDGGNKRFALEKSIGLKSYILSARELSITWGYQPMYWIWKFMYGSRQACRGSHGYVVSCSLIHSLVYCFLDVGFVGLLVFMLACCSRFVET
ncbi:F-box protein PP2-B15-like [Camellia sinensis]|uniref:F-box protein PP2-B15-like n=1 Tax=Camellia sinensis TaxID=4442 RepID=UPI00103568D7|nr:F-box protein PP2-B15-like [Camellia sinensis]